MVDLKSTGLEMQMDKKDNKKLSEVEQLKQEIAKKDATIVDYTDHLKRLQAEFENYCKRVEKERKEVAGFASEKLVVKLLLVIDDFERALAQLKNVPEETRKGIEMIFKNLHKIMDEEKVVPIKAVGEKFDPYKHEVLMQAESDKPDDIILEELQKGYTMNGKVIRYSKIKISKHAEKAGGK
ncbi:MAG TPA: nucleotide exchange factor GrpE [Candidatus Nanoarchaeia archaeon]|nr:nucleotide exchange factor GrpE [Candidatus Nanoarchaeia archaeon]